MAAIYSAVTANVMGKYSLCKIVAQCWTYKAKVVGQIISTDSILRKIYIPRQDVNLVPLLTKGK